MKTKILVAALAAAGLATVSTAQAEGLSITGQVNVAAIDGAALDDITIVDNNTTGSRFRFKAAKKFGNGLKVGTRYELQAQFAQSNQNGQIGNNSGGADGTVREVRYADIWLKGGFGKVSIGRGDGPANGTSESYGILNFLGGAEAHLLFGGAGAGFTDVDGASRQNRIRYDSPKFSGFSVAASIDDQDVTEYAAYYSGKVAGGKLKAQVGVVDGNPDLDVSGSNRDTLDFSIAYKFPFGLGLAYSHGELENPTTGATINENDWFMVSYDIGKNFVISAGFGEEKEGGDDELNIFSLVWKPVKGAEIYLNYGDWDNNNLADNGANNPTPSANSLAQQAFADDNAVALGARFKF